MKSGETERVEVVVAQGLLERRVSGHAPEARGGTGGDRGIELRYATTAQFNEAVVPVLPLPAKGTSVIFGESTLPGWRAHAGSGRSRNSRAIR